MGDIEKKTICLVTNWYPTKENPYQGLFFKEQAFAVSERFDFVIFRYYEKIRQLRGIEVYQGNVENNTKEYEIRVRIPIYVILANAIHDFAVKKIHHKTMEGVGRYVSHVFVRFRKKRFKKILKNYVSDDFDVLYCVDAQKEAAVLKVLSELTGKPYIVGEHAPVPWPGTVLDDDNKAAIEQADLFMAISYDKIRQLSLLNIRLPQTVYIGNLVDESQFVLDTKKDEEHIKTFIIVAANSFYKNYDMFIEVMNRLCDITEVPFKVMIVGYGANKGYSKDIEGFENKIHNSKFSDKAELIREVPHSQIPEVLGRADAFVMTSIQEGQPVSAMEAACCGLPIFSTRCGGVEDYVDDKIGRIYSVGDIEGMANGLKDYLGGRLNFESSYIREQVVKKFGRQEFINSFAESVKLLLI